MVALFTQQLTLILKNKRLHICLLIILILTFSIQGVSIAADNGTESQDPSNSQSLKLSLDDAVKKAADSSSELSAIDISIKKLWKVTDENKSFAELSSHTQGQLELIDTYFQLFEKNRKYDDLNTREEQDLLLYNNLFGDIPEPYSKQQLYERYINGTVIPYYSSWLQNLDLMNTYDNSKARIKGDTQRLYFNLLYSTELSETFENSIDTMEKQYSGILLKCEKGLISELEKYQFEVTLNKKKLELKKQKRNKELQELLLKQLCGIPRSQVIQLTSKNVGLDKDYKLGAYSSYYDKAIENRSEVVGSKLQLEVLRKQLEFVDKYIRQQYSFDRMNLEQQIEDAEFSISQSILNVTGDIQAAYSDVTLIQSQKEIQKRNAVNKKADYDIAVKKYSLGQISLIDLYDARDAASTAEIEYRKAQRDMAYSYYRLELANGFGPGYR